MISSSQTIASPILHNTGRFRTAIDQLSRHQRWGLAGILAGKISLGLLDLFMAILLYRFFLLLQGSSRAITLPPLGVSLNLTWLALIVLIGFLIRMIGEAAVIRWTNVYRQRLYTDFSRQLTAAYMQMSWVSYVNRNKSDLIKCCLTTAQDGAYAYQLITEQVAAAVVVGILAAGCFFMSFVPSLTIILFLCGLLLIHRIWFRKQLQKITRARENILRRLYGGFSELFSSAKEIRVYNNVEYFEKNLLEANTKFCESNEKLSSFPQISRCFIEQGAMIAFTLMTIVIYQQHVNTQYLISMLVFYFVLVRRMLPAVSQMFMAMGQLDGAFNNIDVVTKELADARAQRQQSRIEFKPGTGKILELDSVSFSYPTGTAVTQNMSFSVSPGEIVVCRGISGEGKTTLLNLIAGLLHSNAGKICVDRSKIAYVPQEVVLLDDSIRANVVFGRSGITDDDVNAALETACLAKFISELPQGLDTTVGDNGNLLSGGQRQRLGIARAVVCQPKLLLLDEATSALDIENEKQILRNLSVVMSEGAILFVTHRKHSVLQTERAFRIDHGRFSSEIEVFT